ncbi:acetyl-CoA carboxylase biotin carboxylase subunit family protein [Streptomyces sp. NPDC051561]|uniref:acetyl-CoA carboxylase biotin carboxylase subunit family protein n=1 Tax=Streptomyces sp. NPDC051561 TaxID=3365658 RepID=UPI0037B25434
MPQVPSSPSTESCIKRNSPGSPVLLVVEPTDALYRGYCLESVAAAYDVVVVTPGPLTWETSHVVDYEAADPYDQQALLKAGEALARRHTIAGVLTWNEMLLVNTAHLAQHLGVRTDSPEVLRGCRDKATSRTHFARHEVPSARSAKAGSLLEAALLAERTGYPIVLKPAGQAGSIGVIRVDQAEQLPHAYEFASSGAQTWSGENADVLVEEYLDGPEISVECVTYQGVTTPVAVTRKTVGFAPYFEEVGHSVDAFDPLLPAVGPVAVAAVRALGITTGIQHVEVRLTATGPRLIEVNARVGGDLIGRLVQLSTGIDLPRAAADLALGVRPHLTPTRQGAAAIRLLYPETSGTVLQRDIDPVFARNTEWLEQVSWIIAVGDQVTLPPAGDVDAARVGLLVVTAPDAGTAARRLRLAEDHTTVVVEPGRTLAGGAEQRAA